MVKILSKRGSRRVAIIILFAAIVVLAGYFKSKDSLGYKPKLFDVVLKVDFGPAEKPSYEGTLEVEEGSTANEAVSRIFPIRSGVSCCSLRELIEIDGVSIDPDKNRWWICRLNNSKKGFTPHRTKLRPGDIVEWKFIENVQ